ncbi:MAG: prohibitin family protein [bacterium]
MKNLKLLLWLLAISGIFGFAGPYLISKASTTAVLCGAALLIGFFFVVKILIVDRIDWKKLAEKFPKIFVLSLLCLSMTACSKVPAGYRGVKVYLLGTSKGIDTEEVGVGRYWIGWNEELYLFPTFLQNYVWTKNPAEGSPDDESITFQTKEGMAVNADVGISYSIKPDKVSELFQKYRKGVEEITDVHLRNIVRDAFVTAASKKEVEYVYGEGKAQLTKEVEDLCRQQLTDIGIIIEKVYLIGDLRLPKTVVAALNAKIEAKQRAEQRENELREAQAEAQKKIAQAQGEAQSILVKAEAQAKANKLLAESITPVLVQYEMVTKWNGTTPQIVGQSGILPMIEMNPGR